MSLGRGHTADGRNPAQAGLICRLQALGWIFQFRGPVRGPGSFSMPGWGSGWRPGQCLDWGQVAQRSDQEDVDFLLWTEAAFCPAMPPGPAPGICLPRPLSGDEKGCGSAGGECLGSGAVPLHSNAEGLSPPVHVSPGSLPTRGLSLAAPTVSARPASWTHQAVCCWGEAAQE